ncbi:response regulator transcription factor [Pedobacter sandarakinus]|uniref:response regulator transcription factor n=1 Tax=Pedobacter sandarakinus TaxID=353156 RepID=UPI002246871D|nr:response regulator [Pedobacter sandarakinus]MCX2575881.1 response regulator [Pedobacter sandarakinus]
MPHTILLIDDENDLLQFMSEVLGEHYTVLTASDGFKAIDVLEQHAVHLIISDVMMPGMDGFELCAKIKSSVEYAHIPIILLTAKNTFSAKIEGLNHGADAYIEKPFSYDLVLVQVANLLKNRSKVREHALQDPFSHLKFEQRSQSDNDFLQKLDHYILKNLSNSDFDIDDLAEHMNMSRPTLYRRIKQLLDVPVKDLVTQARLNRSVQLMAENNHKIFEIAQIVGYKSQTVFGRSFQRYFKQSPIEYISALRDKLNNGQ